MFLMKAKTIPVSKISSAFKSFKNSGKKIVLVGGCFDILHPGHVVFLEKAKKAGDILVVLLESDEKVRKLKGNNRPVHSQKERAKVLSALTAVDYVVILPFMESGMFYEEIVRKIQPDIIALTQGYGDFSYHKKIAKTVGISLKYVTGRIGNHSTSKILNS